MTNLIALILLIHYAYFLIMKPKAHTFGCGVFAWLGNDTKDFSPFKFDILGILNETRGEHSCGVTAEGNIKIGVNNTKVYRDFIALAEVPRPNKIPGTIGHTRHATFGSHTIDNAHPFGFGDMKDNDSFRFVGVHNGTLLNHRELAEKYEIDIIVTDDNGKFIRNKIDSEIILEILYKTGNFKVLNDYNGAAALIWQFLEEPDVMYFYHGQSKLYKESKGIVEERSLYFFKESKNSMYVSSLEDSLFAIGGDPYDVEEFEHNTVYKVIGGDVSTAKKIKISRPDNFQKEAYGNYNYPSNNTNSHVNQMADKKGKPAADSSAANVAKESNIYYEPFLTGVNALKGEVYFNKLRYSRNGHKINGVWTYVNGYGFYYLGDNAKVGEETFWRYTNKHFFEGGFYSANKIPKEGKDRSFVPFKHIKGHLITNPPLFYFFKGIMMDSMLDVAVCRNRADVGRAFPLVDLSRMSMHPIIDTDYSFRHKQQQQIFYKGKQYTGSICPLGSGKVYHVTKGNLIKFDSISTPTTAKNNDLIAEILKEEDKERTLANKVIPFVPQEATIVDNDLLEEEITKMFATAYDNFPRYKEQLEKYGNHPRAKRASLVLNTFLNMTYNLLTIEEKE